MTTEFTVTPSIDEYAEISIQEILNHFKVNAASLKGRLIKFMLRMPARRFAGLATNFDRLVGTHGLQHAALSILPQFIPRLKIIGSELVPSDGPVLVAVNHPGGADSIALISSVPRPDMVAIVGERPLLRALVNCGRHFIFISPQGNTRMEGMRAAIARLHTGQTMLIFPRGSPEPDPAFMPGALESLHSWSTSIGIFLKKVPSTRLVPAIISGTISPRIWRSPLSRLYKSAKIRLQLCLTLQLALQQVRPNYLPACVTVRFGPPVSAEELSPSLDVDELTHSAVEHTAALLAQ